MFGKREKGRGKIGQFRDPNFQSLCITKLLHPPLKGFEPKRLRAELRPSFVLLLNS
jgi:hypothetical protein